MDFSEIQQLLKDIAMRASVIIVPFVVVGLLLYAQKYMKRIIYRSAR